MTAYRHVAQPIQIGGATVKNRIVRSAHATGYAANGTVTDDLIAYHEARSRGGVGLTVVEICGVHPTAPGSIHGFTDACIDGLGRLGQAIHRHGATVFQQIWNAGSHGLPMDGGPAWGPSDVPAPHTGKVPLPMTRTMIDEMVASFAATAQRCERAGLDGVEVHGAHGYLVCQFLSPLTNRRDDEYGGDPVRRRRFLEEVLRAIRSSVSPGFAVGLRLSVEAVDGGLESDDLVAVATALEAEGLIDYLSVSMGSYYNFPKFIGAMHEPLGYELPTSEPVTRSVGIPTIVAGRIMDLHDADRLIAEGITDMVTMVRATIADPEIVAKSLAGQEGRVRPCLSCNQGCVGGLLGRAHRVGCVVNPDVGRETRIGDADVPVARPRRVWVIGGGPAGLEAARTAAARGHDVVLFEAQSSLGGTVQLARRAPHREDVAVATDWLADEVRRLGVDVRLGVPCMVEDITGTSAEAPDVVVVATGVEPRRDGVSRRAPAHEPRFDGSVPVATSTDVLGNVVRTGQRALLYDDVGHVAGVSVAEHLLQLGSDVVLATSQGEVGAELGASLQRGPAQARLFAHPGFVARSRVRLSAVEAGIARLVHLDSATVEDVKVDLVVLETGGDPRRWLYHELLDAGIEAVLCGDAADPADLQAAFASGRAVGRAL